MSQADDALFDLKQSDNDSDEAELKIIEEVTQSDTLPLKKTMTYQAPPAEHAATSRQA